MSLANKQEQSLELQQIIEGVHAALDTHPIHVNGNVNMTFNGVGDAFQFLMNIQNKQSKDLEEIKRLTKPLQDEADARDIRNKFLFQMKQKPVIKLALKLQHKKWFWIIIAYLTFLSAQWTMNHVIDPDRDSQAAKTINNFDPTKIIQGYGQ